MINCFLGAPLINFDAPIHFGSLLKVAAQIAIYAYLLNYVINDKVRLGPGYSCPCTFFTHVRTDAKRSHDLNCILN